MDFSTATVAPVSVTIDGTQYTVPRFMLPKFQEWAARRVEQTFQAATDYLKDPEQKARFRLYWSEPLFDVAAMAEELRTPQGVAYVLETCLREAAVPAETVQKLIDNADPVKLRALAGRLASVDQAVATLQAQSGDGGKGSDPTTAASATAGAARPTGESTPPDSPPPSEPEKQVA